ncbi:hypothetical protein BZG02_12005 [Labilibaculum filiforme]|uniref:Porin n=1 Tax=Labilibaculum filiforme TaxID=1940526 RepID=A0A2N3HWP3_9BACT|nr:hypothetical protein [Labilibaculum filiforme]PKQ62448.1 hypothetical protein BZG02_12005 [Labilibaculum filiforme]
MKKIITLLFVTSFVILNSKHTIHAQDVHSPFLHYKEFQEADSSKLFLRFENLNFVKNNEYNGDYLKGTTWIGYIATPKLVYYPSEKFRIEAGVRLQKYSGRENFTDSEPIFSATYKVSNNISFMLGSLNQDNNHNLSEPMFEPERYFTDNGENGLQMKYHSNKLEFDTWINWEQFILENDPFQEKFTFGLTGRWKLNSTTTKNTLAIPVEIMFAHRGGEIDNSIGSVQTIGNFASGLEYVREIENSAIKSWRLKVIAYYFSDNSSAKEFTYDKGRAFYPQFTINTKKSKLNLGYWNAYKFASSRGSELFKTRVIASENYIETRKELITLNYYYEHKVATGIYLGGKLDVYYDRVNSVENFATSIYLKINGDFFLKTIKWN